MPIFAPGSIIADEYRVECLLGQGGMAVVYLCQDVGLDRQVVVKVMNDQLLLSPDARQRFLQEARTMARLDHPNVMPVLRVLHRDDLVAIIMPHYPGESLADLLDRTPGQPLGEVEALRIFEQLLAGVHAAHQADPPVVHRDIKPDNIYLADIRGEPRALLMDFGIAKVLQEGRLRTQTGARMGTVAYMAPEQIQASRSVGPAADIFSLGVVLYEMLCGHRPFLSDSDLMLPAIVVSAPMPEEPLQVARPELRAVVRRCLQKSEDDRFPGVEDLMTAVRNAVSGDASSGQGAYAVGDRIAGRFLVEEALGGERIVSRYACTDERNGYERMVSVCGPKLASAGGLFRRSFLRGVAAQICIDSPYVAKISEVIDDLDLGFVSADDQSWQRCRSLCDVVEGSERIDFISSLRVFRQILFALDSVHRNGVVHRDVKSSSILVSSAGPGVINIKLSGFHFALCGTSPIDEADIRCGTLQYISPEQFLDSSSATAASDVYSASVILHEMLFGCRPYVVEEGESATEFMRRVSRDDSCGGHMEDLPPWLRAVMKRALSKSPVDRYQGALEMAVDMYGVLGLAAE